MTMDKQMLRARTAEVGKTGARTPGPWYFVETDASGDPEFFILPEGGSPAIASGYIKSGRRAKEGRANAAFIVTACNVHDDLIGALQKAKSVGDDNPTALHGEYAATMYNIICAALANAGAPLSKSGDSDA